MRKTLLFALVLLCLFATLDAADVVLKWDAYPDPSLIAHLELQRAAVSVDASGNPTQVPTTWSTVSAEIAPTEITFKDQVEPGGYYWRLRAVTSAGVGSKWSNWTFKTIELGEPSGLTAD